MFQTCIVIRLSSVTAVSQQCTPRFCPVGSVRHFLFQSAACAAAFFYSQTKLSLSLPLHLLILVVTNAMAAIAFFMVERSTSQRQRDGYARVVTHGSEEDVRSDVTDKQQQVPPQGSAGYTSFDSKGHDEDEGQCHHEDKGQGDELVAPGGGVENHAVAVC